MAKNPQGIVPSDASVSLFDKIIGKTYSDIYSTLEKANPVDKFRTQQTLNQIKGILNQANEATQAWVKVNIPGFYEKGMFETVKGLNARGSSINIDNSFANFHKEAIEALSRQTYATIAGGMAGVQNMANVMISNATRQGVLDKIIKGQITGDTRKAVQKSIADELKKSGLTALVDRSGRTWDLNRYGDMLARTSLTQAHNSGLTNRMAAGGYDLVMVSSHYTSCDNCAPWQAQVLSLTGSTPGFDTLSKAEGAGLFHPNCRHTYSPYHNEYLDKSQVWDTEQQKYVSMDEMKANNFYRQQFEVVSKSESKLMDYGKPSYMKTELHASTIGMKKTYADMPNLVLDGSQVLPNNLTVHIIDDMGRKIERAYSELSDRSILDKMHSTLDAKQYKTLEDLHADLAITAKSLGVPADPFAARLANVESVFLNPTKAKIEKLVVLDPKTGSAVFSTSGFKSQVKIPSDVWSKFKDNIMAHNHPNGSSFSLNDMLTASKLNVSKIRAVGDKASYELVRPVGGWNASPNEIRKMYQIAADDIQKRLPEVIAGATTELAQRQAIAHAIVEQTSGALGWEYKKL